MTNIAEQRGILPYTDQKPTFDRGNEEVKHISGAIQALVIGYFMSDIIGDPNLQFGEVNDREVKQDHIARLYHSFVNEGMFHRDPLPLFLRPSWMNVDMTSLVKVYNPTDADTLPLLALNSSGKDALRRGSIQCSNGRHRRGARQVVLTRAMTVVGSREKPLSMDPLEDPRLYRNLKRAQKDVENFPFLILNLGKA